MVNDNKGPKLCAFCDLAPGHDGPHLPGGESLETRVGKAALKGWVDFTLNGEVRTFEDNHTATGAAVLAMEGVHTFAVPEPDTAPDWIDDQWTGSFDDHVTDYVAAVSYDGDIILGVTGASSSWLSPATAIEMGQKLIAAGLRGIEVEKEREADATREADPT